MKKQLKTNKMKRNETKVNNMQKRHKRHDTTKWGRVRGRGGGKVRQERRCQQSLIIYISTYKSTYVQTYVSTYIHIYLANLYACSTCFILFLIVLFFFFISFLFFLIYILILIAYTKIFVVYLYKIAYTSYNNLPYFVHVSFSTPRTCQYTFLPPPVPLSLLC